MHNRLLINALSTVGQVITTGFTYFLLYGIWIRELGAKQLGIWSIVWTTTYFAGMANSGVPVGIVKFIAEAHVKKDMMQARSIVTMSIIITTLLNFLICTVLYLNASWLFQFLIQSPSEVATAKEIFPLALLAFWLLNLANVFMYTLDGFQVNYLRSILNIAASITLFISAYLLIYKGLWGIVIAHIIYTLFILLGSVFMVVRYMKTPFIFNLNFEKQLFINFFKYSIKLQIASASTLLYDPITKFLLAKYNSLDAVGFYEMANRLVTQIRSVIVTANQVMVPKIVETSINSTNNFQHLYIMMFRLLTIISTPLLFSFFFFAPFISLIWIGKIETFFVFSVYTLVVGWYLNTLSVPAYISNMGVGQLRHNIIQHLAMALLNVFLGVLGGFFFEGYGVVSAWTASLSISSGILIYLFHRKNNLNFDMLRFEGDYNYIVSLLVLLIGASIFNFIFSKSSTNWVLIFIIYSIIYFCWLFWIVKSSPFINELRLRFNNFRFLKKN